MNTPVVKNSSSEHWVLLTLLFILISSELGIRLFEEKLSGNINHIYEIPSISKQINNNQNKTLVFIGNSLSNNAINTNVITESLNTNDDNSISSYKITPDGTSLSDWFCIYKNQLNPLSKAPSQIVIGFAWAQLSDQYPINPTRLGGFFCKIDNVAELSSTGLTHHQQLLRYLAGKTSHIYTNREAIRNRSLSMLIPGYQEISQQINRSDETRSNRTPTKHYTFELLTKLIKSIRESGSDVAVMAMPVINNYEIDSKLIDLLDILDVTFIDMRNNNSIENSMFKDSIHLNKEGQYLFSQELSNLLMSDIHKFKH